LRKAAGSSSCPTAAGRGPYIGDELAAARQQGGLALAGQTLSRLMATTHLSDQLAALAWLQAPLLQAAREARAPVLLFQARNDHDLAPHEALRQEMQRAGRSVALRLYPAAGQNAQQGHAFAYQGSSVWFADVISFLQRHCP
jgi:dienelactone hydrolase